MKEQTSFTPPPPLNENLPFPSPSQCASLDIETSGLNPQKNFITCIGWLMTDGMMQFTDSHESFNTTPESAEKYILNQFFLFLHTETDAKAIITYNGEFDYSFIKARAEKYNLFLPKRFLEIPHIDLALFFKKINGYKIAKDFAALKYANIYVPRKNTGAFLARSYTYKQVSLETHVDMLSHNAIDLAVTLKLYKFLLDYPDFREFYEGDIE